MLDENISYRTCKSYQLCKQQCKLTNCGYINVLLKALLGEFCNCLKASNRNKQLEIMIIKKCQVTSMNIIIEKSITCQNVAYLIIYSGKLLIVRKVSTFNGKIDTDITQRNLCLCLR